ncbi:FecR family protein [Komagataeibacter diospyri]|uniref:Two component sensor histidine kinase FecR/PupR n=1 Tax=Komagataeibacter diospyri TaxID=1932662 RepID=A0A4P5NT22_9PROT|nr:FecR family protein [Komagataeibacter diospyri]GCE82675.1 two component sensor histidine kinase FecR/PupR [Komagataeibacter diospyri]
MTDSTDDQQDRIDTEAAEWVIRLGGGKLNPEEKQAFATWRSASPLHEAAFQRASSLWSDLDVGSREKKARHRRTATHVTTAGIAGLFVLGLGIGTGWVEPGRWLADYTTPVGEIHTVHLADGSTAVMDSHTALSVRYTASERRIVLIDGDAWFRVAPLGATEHRPFVIEAVRGTSTALGTQFMVERDPDGVRTTVTEHSVRVVTRPPDGLTHSVVVAEGQSVRYGRDGSLDTPQAAPIAAITAWRSGQLVFDNEPLSEVIARLNRYRQARIMLMGARLRDRRVSGVFSCSDIDGAVSSITRQLALRSVSVAGLATIIY